MLSTFSLSAEEGQNGFKLGAPFADNAILQREMDVPVWGWGKKGSSVTVEFAGQKKNAVADADGKWMVKLDPLKANAEPQQMTVSAGTTDKQVVKNILIGEVWMASGQSNMQWEAGKCDTGRVLQAMIKERVAAGKEKPSVIREAKVTDYFSALHPIEHASVEWKDSGTSASAVAYAFAYKLYKEIKVPIGILNCSFSQTSIQAWTPRQGYRDGKDPYTQAIYKKILESDPSTPEHKKAWAKFYSDIEETLKKNKELVAKGEPAQKISVKTPGNLNGNRDATWLFNARTNPVIPYAIRGAIWNQGYASMNEGLVYYNNLHSMIRGWRELWNRPNLPVYFHQFYCPGQKNGWDHSPSIGRVADMRIGTWLARDIPHTAMASQIDITGSIHYFNKTLPGQRLALHALKNQYQKDIVSDGPMFKSYKVEGNKVTVELEFAQGGLVVAETGSNSKSNLAIPKVIPSGDEQVKCFYLAGEDKVWHPAKMEIKGEKIVVTSPGVKQPKGISYGTGGIGNQPNVYNKAMLPLSPFIYFDQKLVTAKSWSADKLVVAGVETDPNAGGLRYAYRKMPLLSTQFRENAVLQADKPVTIWGSAIHDWGYEAEGEAVIRFSFAGVEKVIPVKPGMKEWRVTLPAMKASAEPQTLKVTFSIDGALVHEREIKGIVFGDVYYVAAPKIMEKVSAPKTKSKSIVRELNNQSKRSVKNNPSRFSVAVSTTPLNRFAAYWKDAGGFAARLGHEIGAKTGRPVGIIFMQSKLAEKDGKDWIDRTKFNSWIYADDLKLVPQFLEDYKNLAVTKPGNDYYDKNAMKYVSAWKKYWGDYIPALIASRAAPDLASWGSYPSLNSDVTSKASQTYNVMVHSFTPLAAKGIIFISGEAMVSEDKGKNFGPSMSVLANTWRKRMESEDATFYFTQPNSDLAPQISKAVGISGQSIEVELSDWKGTGHLEALVEKVVADALK